MKLYVGVTDKDWFNLLCSQENLEEVNFWRPSGNSQFKAIHPGELFLFKLHSPDDFIVGGGILGHSTILPISLAWEAFGIANGAISLPEMRERVGKYRRLSDDRFDDYQIGCLLLEQPFFLKREGWIPVPADWKPNIVQGRSYDLNMEPGLTLWKRVQISLRQSLVIHENPAHYGKPILVKPRLGQGTFRIAVTDAYQRYCAITKERTLPALDAAHIKPFAESGPNKINNGILLRRDLHALFDKGYITVTPFYEVEVSRKIKEEFENGKDYYKYHGNIIHLPDIIDNYPSYNFLEWHNENVYRG